MATGSGVTLPFSHYGTQTGGDRKTGTSRAQVYQSAETPAVSKVATVFSLTLLQTDVSRALIFLAAGEVGPPRLRGSLFSSHSVPFTGRILYAERQTSKMEG